MTLAQEDRFFAYYEDMKSKVFGRPDWNEVSAPFSKMPKARFVIDREFDFKAPYSTYNFLVDLSQKFGSVIVPIRLERACISLKVAFREILDFSGKDFRVLMLADTDYHRLFRKYDVTMIYLEQFPESPETPTRFANVGFPSGRYKVSSSGQPLPY